MRGRKGVGGVAVSVTADWAIHKKITLGTLYCTWCSIEQDAGVCCK